ncbi:uncharacterized protein LOC118192446 [Stegodyphus dumicola]|uniref:uncharacterized protein LOC118192446 n=1 Tax=Stegodyphus dumicola TaxID=202533 RepID=UPI0015B3599D|nr:uncharacterized protein LOC118192446 [Stegodyphus dumicola]
MDHLVQSMDVVSSSIKILGKGGGSYSLQRWCNWDCKLAFGVSSNSLFGASSCSSDNCGVRVKNTNDLLKKSGKMLLYLFILLLHGPGLVSCGKSLDFLLSVLV